MAEMKLVKKITEVMKQVKYIQKTGFNSFNNYKYATEADVNERVREELADRSVILIPNVKSHSVREHTNRKGHIEYIVTVEVEFTFHDGETGETITFTTFGEGQDAGDKGTYKAITGAQKYALMKSLMIPTGDDPEGDTGVDERNQQNDNSQLPKPQQTQTQSAQFQPKKLSEGQVNRLYAIAKSKGFTVVQVKEVLMKDYKKTAVEELTKQEYDALCSRLETAKGA